MGIPLGDISVVIIIHPRPCVQSHQSFRLNNPWLTEFATHLQALLNNVTGIDILVPLTVSWRPGQHCFPRFPSLSIFDNHPFTITSASHSAVAQHGKTSSGVQPVSFFVRSHAGFTRKLSCYSSHNFDEPIHSWIDGLYGGVGRRSGNGYDTMRLIAGGSGITSYLPWIQQISRFKQHISSYYR